MEKSSTKTEGNTKEMEKSSTKTAPDYEKVVQRFFGWSEGSTRQMTDPNSESKDYFSELLRDLLKVDRVTRGSVSCSFSVAPLFTNLFNGLHGGAVASIAERVCIGCARSVVGEDKAEHLFLGELSISYLSAAQQHEEVTVDASVVRSGRNLTVVSSEFRIKTSGKLVYTARATFYHMPASKL